MDIVEKLTDRAYQARAFKEAGEMLVMDERQARLDEATAAEIAALRKRVAELEGALEPFANYPDYVDKNKWEDDGHVSGMNGLSVLFTTTIGHLRRARATLKGGTDGR